MAALPSSAAIPSIRARLGPWPRPGLCPLCGSWTASALCHDCLELHTSRIARCRTCALPLAASPASQYGTGSAQCIDCRRQPGPLSHCIAALPYAFPWSTLIQAFKFQQRLELLPALLSQMEAALDAAQVHPPKLLLCVPLSATRLAERGYNQAHELARRLAARRGLAYAPMALERIKDQHKQSLLDREARASNVRHAFLVNPQATGLLQGQRVAIVDDIMTTGATLNELARLLRRAGASEVQAWVLARA